MIVTFLPTLCISVSSPTLSTVASPSSYAFLCTELVFDTDLLYIPRLCTELVFDTDLLYILFPQNALCFNNKASMHLTELINF